MTKAVIDIGYNKYVLDLKDAVTVLEMLGKAEKYQTNWSKEGNTSLHYIYSQEESMGSLSLLGEGLYRMAKLAGKPPAA